METHLLVSSKDGVATLTLNRPTRRNALNPELISKLGAELRKAASDPDLRLVVLTGAEGSFCAGADLTDGFDPRQHTPSELAERLDSFQALIRLLVTMPQIVLAVIDGPAVGFGADLALAADLRIMSKRGYFQERFVQLGLMSDGGASLLLPRLVGVGRALELLLTGRAVHHEEALAIGLVSDAVEQANLQATMDAWSTRLREAPPLALRHIKQAVRRATLGDLDAALAHEKEGQLALLATEDLEEGLQAFREKRPPRFRGR